MVFFQAHTTQCSEKIQNTRNKKKTYDIRKIKHQGPTNRPTYQRLYLWTRELSSLTRDICHGGSGPDPHETCVSRVNRKVADRVGSGLVRRFANLTGRVGSGQQFVTSRGSGRVNSFLNLAGRVGSRQKFFLISRVVSGRVKRPSKSRGSGRVGSSPHTSIFSRVKSGQLTRPDPTRSVRFDPTRESPGIFQGKLTGMHTLF